jgi:hypothetical protein
MLSGCEELSRLGDSCSSKFDECNYECGEGFLSSLCKQKCTSDYQRCKESNK